MPSTTVAVARYRPTPGLVSTGVKKPEKDQFKPKMHILSVFTTKK
jgi:hypothetical protein